MREGGDDLFLFGNNMFPFGNEMVPFVNEMYTTQHSHFDGFFQLGRSPLRIYGVQIHTVDPCGA